MNKIKKFFYSLQKYNDNKYANKLEDCKFIIKNCFFINNNIIS